MENNSPKFSIIISTYNRVSILANSLKSVMAQTYGDYEIIVSDDASTDTTKELVSQITKVRIVYLRNERNLGLSATRNAALKKARGEFLVIIDDDTTLESEFLEKLDRVISLKKSRVFCPMILDPETNEPFVNLFKNHKEKSLGYRDFNYFIGLANIFAREVFTKCGEYDERFGVGARYFSAEESDYFFRLKRTGEKILYIPELIVYHRKEKNISGEKVYKYSYGISAMLTKQLITDFSRWYLYYSIISWRLIISLLRSLQYVFSPNTIREKNNLYKYSYFFKGTLAGIYGYLRFR